MKRFGVIVADPPWPIAWTTPKTRVNGRGERHTNYTQDLSYPTMGVTEIEGLPVRRLASDDSWLFLWAPDRFIIDGSAATVARAWGFAPRRFLVWGKTGMSLGTFPRPQHELCLVCTRGKPSHLRRNVGSFQVWKLVYEKRGNSHARKHSAKPEDFFSLIESSVPGPYLELFARRERPRWDRWGNEVISTVALSPEEMPA